MTLKYTLFNSSKEFPYFDTHTHIETHTYQQKHTPIENYDNRKCERRKLIWFTEHRSKDVIEYSSCSFNQNKRQPTIEREKHLNKRIISLLDYITYNNYFLNSI